MDEAEFTFFESKREEVWQEPELEKAVLPLHAIHDTHGMKCWRFLPPFHTIRAYGGSFHVFANLETKIEQVT
eukprot:790941-Amphidinium_carterae.1